MARRVARAGGVGVARFETRRFAAYTRSGVRLVDRRGLASRGSMTRAFRGLNTCSWVSTRRSEGTRVRDADATPPPTTAHRGGHARARARRGTIGGTTDGTTDARATRDARANANANAIANAIAIERAPTRDGADGAGADRARQRGDGDGDHRRRPATRGRGRDGGVDRTWGRRRARRDDDDDADARDATTRWSAREGCESSRTRACEISRTWRRGRGI